MTASISDDAAGHGASSPIDRISDQVVTDFAALSPLVATYFGLPTTRLLDDWSPAGRDEIDSLLVSALADAERVEVTTPAEVVARDVLVERLQVWHDAHAAGDAQSSLNVIASPVQELRQLFDLVATETADDLQLVADRIAAVPATFAGYRSALVESAAQGRVSARRQVDRVAEQCDAAAGDSGTDGYFRRYVGELVAAHPDYPVEQAERMREAALAADRAYGNLGAFLRAEIAPQAPAADAVGAEHYARASREYLGAEIDLGETYAWGWEEFLGLEAELLAVGRRIAPGASPRAVAEQLDADPRYQVVGADGLQRWMQQLSDDAVAELGRSHFEIAEPLRRLDCKIAPPGSPVGVYYTGPSDDLTRPGAMWWSVEPGRERFSTWREVTTVYHEGVPGHHLQIGTATVTRDSLNSFQRLLAGTSGHMEGWALYAERLVRELGYLDDDGDLLGMLDAQLFRAARVVIDIGVHLELEIPAGTGFHEGERWTPDLALEFLLDRTLTEPAFARAEIDRYLGWPGQAPSYKIGERLWLAGRDEARARHGAAFDPKRFHTAALQFGGMGLGPLAELLATI